MSASAFVNEFWDSSIIPSLSKFIEIPNLSPDYDENWASNGLQEKAANHVVDWVTANKPEGTTITLHEKKGITPFLQVDVAPFKGGKGHVLMYGHFDKQPHLEGWSEGLGPCIPAIREKGGNGPHLYGRGSSDDGYSIYAAICAVLDCQKREKAHGHISIIMEGAEESDTDHLIQWMDMHKAKFGNVDLCIILDSGAANHTQLWLTDSLRGVGTLGLRVQHSETSIHSGVGGTVVPDPFRFLRILLDRLEDVNTGDLKVKSLNVDIPDSVRRNLAPFKEMSHEEFMASYSFLPGCAPLTNDHVQLMIDGTWRSSMTITGYEGVPKLSEAGNVIRPEAAVKISIRIPPTSDAKAVTKEVREILTRDPPQGCKVTLDVDEFCAGWAAPTLKPWLEKSLTRASTESFGNTYGAVGCGGSIPFLADLGKYYPEAQFVVTGVLVPGSNAHGIDESMPINYSKKVTNAVSLILEDHQNA